MKSNLCFTIQFDSQKQGIILHLIRPWEYTQRTQMEEQQQVQLMMQDVCDTTFPQGAAITARQTHAQIPLDQLLGELIVQYLFTAL